MKKLLSILLLTSILTQATEGVAIGAPPVQDAMCALEATDITCAPWIALAEACVADPECAGPCLALAPETPCWKAQQCVDTALGARIQAPPAYPWQPPHIDEGGALDPTFVHMPFFDYFTMDLGASISRGVQIAIKYLMGDGTDLVAELVYDGEDDGGAAGGGGSCEGGNGGAYTGDNGSASSPLNAVASTITDIPAEAGAYPSDIKVDETPVSKLADLRIKEIVKENASLDELSQDKWAILYRAQQRSIQAMTDALVMKKAYKELADIANGVSAGSYGNYSEAASTVATRRLTLDALLALRKRVIAARVRARAELMEMSLETVATQPVVQGGKVATTTGNIAVKASVSSENQNTKPGVEDYGLGG